MDRVEGTGDNAVSARSHLEKAAASGHLGAIADLDGPGVPDALEYLLDYYEELAFSRGVGWSGMEPLTYSDVLAWCHLMDHFLEPHEVSALMAMDAASRFPGKVEREDEVREEKASDWGRSGGSK